MKSFDEHFKGAKNHNQEDLKWLLACYYGTMMNLCNEYSYLGDEDLFVLMLEWFWWDFNKFSIYNAYFHWNAGAFQRKGKGFRAVLPEILSLEQSHLALKAMAFKEAAENSV